LANRNVGFVSTANLYRLSALLRAEIPKVCLIPLVEMPSRPGNTEKLHRFCLISASKKALSLFSRMLAQALHDQSVRREDFLMRTFAQAETALGGI
jgi:hypothetical protein